ncbi:MAG: class I adenylate-forming enzyme family protein [Candidatus Sulfotelmatobacter sp.]
MTSHSTSDFDALPSRISDVVAPWAERSPDQPALVEASGSWTYRQLASAVSETQTWLRQFGVRAGDRVMIVGENSRAFVAFLLAAASLDAWPVLVNARLSARELDEIRTHCGARRVFYTTGISTQAAEHAKRHGAAIEEREGFGSVGIGALNKEAVPEPLDANIADRVAALIYTSGTTGLPKGVMLTHTNLLFMAAGSVKVRTVIPDDRIYGILPMSHAVGLSVVLLASLIAGASLYLSSSFDPMSARVILERDRLTLLFGTPAIFNQLLQYAKMRKISSLKFPALRVITSSGAPLDLATKSAVEALFGMVLHNGYGLTECAPTIALTRPEAPRSDISIGPAFPGVEIQLLGNDRQPVPAGEVGELQVRGPNIMKGYYRAPEETSAVIDAEGWFNTRDLAKLEDGNLFIVGRTKDLIVRRGFNVYPAEVEAVLNGHPAVVRSAVVGRAVGGDEEVVAFVQLSPEIASTPAELAAYAARSLTAYKRPSQILILPVMPTTAAGKIAKAELKKIAENNIREESNGPLAGRILPRQEATVEN